MTAEAPDLGHKPPFDNRLNEVAEILPALWVLSHPMASFMPKDALSAIQDPGVVDVLAEWERNLSKAALEVSKTKNAQELVRQVSRADMLGAQALAVLDAAERERIMEAANDVIRGDRDAWYDSEDDPADQKHLPQEADDKNHLDIEQAS